MSQGQQRRHRVDFALMTIAGNVTHVETLRSMVHEDIRVCARWYPIRTWFKGDWLRHIPGLPGMVRIYSRHFLDSWRFLLLPPADAAVIHAFETYPLYVLVQQLRVWRRGRQPVIVFTGDDGVWIPNPDWRGWLARLAVRHTHAFVHFSTWAAERTLERYRELPPERVLVLHPGIDLVHWPLCPPKTSGNRFRLLFVGGDARRKGLATLLDALDAGLSASDLDVVTQAALLPDQLRERMAAMPQVHVHVNLASGSPELRAMYAQADAFVLPTTFDCSSWVALEAMASGVPVVISNVGGIPDIVRHEETGLLIPPGNPQAIVAAVERLRTDDKLRDRLIQQGRTHVEQSFDARVNTGRLIELLAALINGQSVPCWDSPESPQAEAIPVAHRGA